MFGTLSSGDATFSIPGIATEENSLEFLSKNREDEDEENETSDGNEADKTGRANEACWQ